MTMATASLDAFTWVPSCEPSIAPTTITLAPLVTIDWIWFCCSETPPLANATSDLKPAADRSVLNRFSASTQFSEVFCGRETPMRESAGNFSDEPPLLLLLLEPPLSERPQPASARAATAATAITFVSDRIQDFLFSWCGAGL